MDGDDSQNQREDLVQLLIDRIENLRPKLLDLSRRNPLISTKLGPRSSSAVRVVDELPDVLAHNILQDQVMRFVPLPPLDDDPKDEQSREFQSALSEARVTEDVYLAAMEAIDPDSETAFEQEKQAERNLKDRLREQLGMAPHSSAGDISLAQHAKNNGIAPSYDLPLPHQEHEDGRHTDTDIQTLLLPDDLERKLTNILTKCRTWVQETGINVLHGAFGFLEWKEPSGDSTCFAPLILVPVGVEKKRTRDGAEFRVKGLGERAETNLVLAEKLKLDFGIDLPQFEGGSVEEYLQQVADNSPPTLEFRVRRQVVFGVFPSARMAMYHDLDTSGQAFQSNDIIQKLMVGSDDSGASPFADEYLVDDPEVEKKVPNLVLDADSSQFSTLVDVADEKNVALEGPPGTGKSQTIVNAIATALADGKKVLFVAEKMAALEVVRSRLEAVGLGEFVLPLQAERSTREQVIQSLRERVDISLPSGNQDYGVKIERFREYRDELAEYVQALSTEFAASGMNVFQVLGRGIATQNYLSDLPRDIQKLYVEDVDNLTPGDFQIFREVSERLETAWSGSRHAKPYWRGHSLTKLDAFVVEELFDNIEKVADAFSDAALKSRPLTEFGLGFSGALSELSEISKLLDVLVSNAHPKNAHLIQKLIYGSNYKKVDQFLADCKRAETLASELSINLSSPDDPDWVTKLARIEEICEAAELKSFDIEKLRKELEASLEEANRKEAAFRLLTPFVQAVPACQGFHLQHLASLKKLFDKFSRAALSLRSEPLSQHEAAATIRSAAKLAEKLKRERDDLNKVISTSADLSPDQIRKTAAVISGKSSFSFLSSQYRTAKKTYSTVTIRASFAKEQAVDDLHALASWREECDKFLSIPNLQGLLGSQYRGLDSDFHEFLSLVEFYEAIEREFPRIENIAIRTFAKNADIEILAGIPLIELDDCPSTLEQLEREITETRQLVQRQRELLNELESLLRDFKSVPSGGPEQIRSLYEKCQELVNEQIRLEGQVEVGQLLGDEFDGPKTGSDIVDAAMASAEALKDCPEQYQPIIMTIVEADQLGDCKAIVDDLIVAKEIASDKLLAFSEEVGIGFDQLEQSSFDDTAARLRAMRDDKDGLFIFSELVNAQVAYIDAGLPDLPSFCEAYESDECDVSRVTEALVARSLCRRVFQIHGDVLTKFNGERLDDLRSRLARVDRDLIKLSRAQLRKEIYRAAQPPGGNRVGKKSTWTEWALVENEINKKKRFVPIRDLTERAGSALQELKPCWMMSPLAVAQYLKKGGIKFDLCIIDEASQMPPEDAIGALVRCDKALVVGDTNQLPPTSFFRRMIDDEDADEDESVLEESILEMANAAFRPKRRLRWHYRSRHSGLIKFSNKLIYDDDLIVFPSAHEDRKDMGVSYVKVDGVYKAGVNGPEARAIIDAILDFMYHHRNRSLGVVTLNQKQRDLIIEELEFALRKNPWAAQYIDDWKERNDGLESFFIKNLENVQGDERDVIFIGTVYGPGEPGGSVMQRFGPINGLAGRRRLNVLFSRAKEQIVTFSSMASADIRADEHGNPGTFMLKRWLEYSATGVLEGGIDTHREPDSDFEEYVIDQIKSIGCEAVPQVGVAGYFIDIGVKHPDWPHGFILGVECDGASYHSSKSARDRDRLRQEVLENLGWEFHRIWSTDWFNDPAKETQRLREKITDRLEQLKAKADQYAHDQTDEEDVGGTVEVESRIDEDFEPAGKSSEVREVSQNPDGISAGDRVRVRYLSGSQQIVEFTLSDSINDPDNGIVSVLEPIGEALLDAEEGEEVEFLVGSYVRRVVVEKIDRETHSSDDSKPTTPTEPLEGEIYEVEESVQTGLNEDPDLFEGKSQTGRSSLRLSADRFYDDDYLFTIRRLGVEIIDQVGPITYRHLSERIARLHDFQRTGSQIRKRVWKAVNRERKYTKGPTGENIFWPNGVDPKSTIPFRGLAVDGDERSWGHVPYPEKLGLALEIIGQRSSGDDVERMARRIGLSRLASKTREELENLLREVRSS